MNRQLTDFEREVIILFKKANPTWGLKKCHQILPQFFNGITENQFYAVCSRLKRVGSPEAKKRKVGTGSSKKIDSPLKMEIKRLALTPENSPIHRRHSSQREIAKELNISQSSVSRQLRLSNLKCYRRVRCNKLTAIHREGRMLKASALIERFEQNDEWQQIWFSDEASFNLSPPLNSQNERIYREVLVKTDIPCEQLLVEGDRQQPSVTVYGAVSWKGKTQLRFLEGFAEGQENIAPSRRKKKTINQIVYCTEMCPAMFRDINEIMNGETWVWQQDGAKPHTAKSTVAWLQDNVPLLITPDQWPSKSPDLNIMDYSIWGILLQELQSARHDIKTIDDLKQVLLQAWNNISDETLRKATGVWIERLKKCTKYDGGHFEHL
jgi:predicted transcriptional regulator